MDNKVQHNVDVSKRQKLEQQITDLDDKINDLNKVKEQYQQDSDYCADTIRIADNAINKPGFHPIHKHRMRVAKLRASIEKASADAKLFQTDTKIKTLEMRKATLEIKQREEARKIENPMIVTKGSDKNLHILKADQGKVNFSKGQAKKLANKPLFDKSGNPTPEFETLKQIIADYPQSITTLPDNVITALNNQTLTVKQRTSTVNINGQTYYMTEDKKVNGFDYMQGIAAAGFENAKKQGRTMQANPKAETEFADWVDEKNKMLSKTKVQPKVQTNTSTNTSEVFF